MDASSYTNVMRGGEVFGLTLMMEADVADEVRSKDGEMPFSPAVGCLISFLITLLPVCLIIGATVLVVREEITLKTSPVGEIRLWLVREGNEQGVGLSTMQRVAGGEKSDHVCYRSQVHFLLWRSLAVERQSTYCECYEFDGGRWTFSGACP